MHYLKGTCLHIIFYEEEFKLEKGYKWIRGHVILEKDKMIRQYLPETVLFSEDSLFQLLLKYNSVILKPSNGTGGKGIFKLTKANEKKFVLYRGTESSMFKNLEPVINIINKQERLRKVKYLLQMCISLAHIKGKPFDIRVLLQRDEQQRWHVYGMQSRIAADGKFVTNYHQGGALISVPKVFRYSLDMNERQISWKQQEIERIALRIANTISNKFNSSLAGIDFGIDVNAKVWFIEHNPKPNFDLFAKMLKRYG